MVDLGEAQILERTGTKCVKQALASGGRFELAARDLIEQILQLFV